MHTGGVSVLMGDGSARFISENIDVGNQSVGDIRTGPSPYGVWGALGSMVGGRSWASSSACRTDVSR